MCLFSFIETTHKLNFRSQECLFLRYSSSHKGYKWLSSSGKVYISKDVLFNELRFPYFDLFSTSTSSITNLDFYFSLNPNLSPPSVSSISQTSQVSNTTSAEPNSILSFHHSLVFSSILSYKKRSKNITLHWIIRRCSK